MARRSPHKGTVWPRGKLVSLGATELTFDDPVAEALVESKPPATRRCATATTSTRPRASPASQAPPPTLGDGSAAPIARVPQAKSAAARTERGFRTADVVIALLALLCCPPASPA